SKNPACFIAPFLQPEPEKWNHSVGLNTKRFLEPSSFFKTLKAELMWRQAWSTRQEVEQAITLYINNFYNAQRRHSALQWKSPLDHERNVA
ncbi:IS3 family transposase, partial [Gluconobacter oxydans]|uniref:IS3 family transposase n=1 Tax=Gluconobacter oxydans TaxID=442 RepID=UPI00209DAC0B